MSKPTIDSARLANGLTLQYAERGHGAPILLLHGYTDSWYSYNQVMSHLPDDVRALALTQRGHGDSERPDGGYEARDFAGDAVAFLDAMGIDKAAVVGHSMGSFIAQEIALSAPERVSHLVLIGSATTGDNAVIRELAEAVKDLADPLDRAFVHEFQASTLHQPIATEVLDAIVGESMKMPARIWREAAAGLVAFQSRDRLSAIAAPTLVVWGDHDEIFARSEQDALVAAIPRATLKVYENAGHGVHWEQSERFASDLVELVRP